MDTKETIEKTILLLMLCEKSDTRVTLEYDTGRSVNGANIPVVDGKPDFDADLSDYVEQGERGWRVEVALQSWHDQDGVDVLYPTLGEAAIAGLRILREQAEQDGGE